MAEVKRCGDCRHWGTERDVRDKETFRTCRAVVHDKDDLVSVEDDNDPWLEPEDVAVRKDYRAAHKAVVQDGSGFKAALRCREDFGCELFEPKAT